MHIMSLLLIVLTILTLKTLEIRAKYQSSVKETGLGVEEVDFNTSSEELSTEDDDPFFREIITYLRQYEEDCESSYDHCLRRAKKSVNTILRINEN